MTRFYYQSSGRRGPRRAFASPCVWPFCTGTVYSSEDCGRGLCVIHNKEMVADDAQEFQRIYRQVCEDVDDGLNRQAMRTLEDAMKSGADIPRRFILRAKSMRAIVVEDK